MSNLLITRKFKVIRETRSSLSFCLDFFVADETCEMVTADTFEVEWYNGDITIDLILLLMWECESEHNEINDRKLMSTKIVWYM